jgi:hypothetical protein
MCTVGLRRPRDKADSRERRGGVKGKKEREKAEWA